MPIATENSESISATDAEHLRSLGKLINENIEQYLSSLSSSGLPAPSFRPEAGNTSIPSDAAGAKAFGAITTIAQRILALTTGPAGLYDISRQFFTNSALQVAVELDLAGRLPVEGVMMAGELAAMTGAETAVIVRIMRALTPLFIFEEIEPQTYKHTARSALMRDPSVKALLDFGGYEGFRVAAFLPESLKESGYRNLVEPTDAPFCKAFNTNSGFFDYVYKEKPEMGEKFGKAMAGTLKLSYEVKSIAEIFPFDILQKHGGTIVDVGGGMGQAMLSVAVRYPASHLSFTIQDLKGVIEAGKRACPDKFLSRFRWMPHDFFEKQPILRASAYFLRHILHDWSDEYCIRILRPIVEAMLPESSRLLICEMIAPEMNAPMALAHRDLLMMGHLAGMERTERQFVELAKRAHPQLYLEKVWKSTSGGACIMEFLLRE
ncbi:O-methyltransferase-domain-containing protein [Sphaerosporella brunnea]|uniref:O-methyltransferase-domain-containing protein n=1 Tax=Sphaerosporella brunnea TaxID=1250544 RepID=A0A5J5EEM4_9PEZI|nr:O-methyltransferase-domain-containing protein [Sphaerosporella brunnea]